MILSDPKYVTSGSECIGVPTCGRGALVLGQ